MGTPLHYCLDSPYNTIIMFEIVGKVFAQDICDPTQNGIDLGNCLQLSNGVPVSTVYSDPAFLVNLIVRNVFVIAGIVIFLLIFYAGFKFIQDDTKGKEEAQKIITAAVVGIVVMFSAYWVLQIIKVLTGADLPL